MTWDLDATPRVAWVAVQVAPTGWLYQPLKSGPRESCAAIPVGGSASILIGWVVVSIHVPSFSCTWHVRVVPVFGPGTCVGPQFLLSMTGTLSDQFKTTKLPY